MKIRQGFVSNSSSSSFCILGIIVDDEHKEFLQDNYVLIGNNNLEIEYGISDYYGETFLGIIPSNIPENNSIYQTKVDIADKLNKLFIDTHYTASDIRFYTDGGDD